MAALLLFMLVVSYAINSQLEVLALATSSDHGTHIYNVPIPISYILLMFHYRNKKKERVYIYIAFLLLVTDRLNIYTHFGSNFYSF